MFDLTFNNKNSNKEKQYHTLNQSQINQKIIKKGPKLTYFLRFLILLYIIDKEILKYLKDKNLMSILPIIIKQAQKQMRKKIQRQIIDINHAQTQESKVFTEQFQVNEKLITHSNTLTVELRQNKGENFEIKNYFCTKAGDIVTKVTQMHFDDKIIKIVDTFTSRDLPFSFLRKTQDVQPNHEQIKKQRPVDSIVKQQNKEQYVKLFGNPAEESRNRDRRSVVKNIYRLYQRWVQFNTSPQSKIVNELKQLLLSNGSSYNNKLIVRLAENPKFRQNFLTFCSEAGQEYINHSKIRDKTSHLQALEVYRNVCQKQQQNDEESYESQENQHQSELERSEQMNKQMNDVKQQHIDVVKSQFEQ